MKEEIGNSTNTGIQRAILTGATGAIGIALIKELVAHNVEVLVLCREGSKRNERIPEHPLVHKRFCDLAQLSMLQREEEKTYDVFYHFGWCGTTGNARNDMQLQTQNIKYTLDALEAAIRFGCHTFIGAGSQAEYGRLDGLLHQDTPAFPENGYGMAKLCAGQMTRLKAFQAGIRPIWVRILSVYGPGDGAQSLVMSVIHSALAKESPKCTKGEQKWDYLYSKDAARAFRLIGEKGKAGRIYVLGSGQVAPLAEYILQICKAAGTNVTPNLGAIPYAANQVMYLGADISALAADTGFQPEISFEEGIRETIDWVKTAEGNMSHT